MPATDRSSLAAADRQRGDARSRRSAWGLLLLLLPPTLLELQPRTAHAFPPAPNHEVYGVVRDALGHPLADGAEILFESGPETRLHGFVLAQADSDSNYRLQIPMDAGVTSDRFVPTALLPAAPFRLRVVLGGTSYLPIEMTGDLVRLGVPGGHTRLDLTLGLDEDGNGLPDAWEKAVAERLGLSWAPGKFRGADPFPGSGLSFRDVYLAGTYALIPPEGFALEILGAPEGSPRLAFTAVAGRTYRIECAERLGDWSSQPFRVLAGMAAGEPKTTHQATDTRRVEIRAEPHPDTPARFYRLRVE